MCSRKLIDVGQGKSDTVFQAEDEISMQLQVTIMAIWTPKGQTPVARAFLPGNQLPDGIYCARSLDGGDSLSEPLDAAIGSYGWPQVMGRQAGRVQERRSN